MATEPGNQKPVIECAENGPYIVRNLNKLSNSKGDGIVTKAVIALCRCGDSKNKPFCDGTHKTKGFSSENLSDDSKDRLDSYVGKKITIQDNRAICAHAGICTDSMPSVWRMRVEPWIDPDAGDVEAIIETIKKCPSGALSYSIESREHRDQDRSPEVFISKDGPYDVVGGIELKDVPRAEGASTENYTLCRCGASKNKPFCDGTHWDIEFKDEKN